MLVITKLRVRSMTGIKVNPRGVLTCDILSPGKRQKL